MTCNIDPALPAYLTWMAQAEVNMLRNSLPLRVPAGELTSR